MTRPNQINIRLTDLELAKLDNYASLFQISRSEALRMLIQKLPKPKKDGD